MRRKIASLGSVLFLLAFSKVGFAGDADEEMKFGYYADRVIVSSQTILFSEALSERISEIGNTVAGVSERPGMNYTFRIINDPTINAYSVSGGFIYVTTGLLDILESEDELAGVLAHEIHHTNASHQMKFIYAAYQRRIAGSILGIFFGYLLGAGAAHAVANSPYYAMSEQLAQERVRTAVKLGMALGDEIGVWMVKGYGKEQELEADARAVEYTQKAGYDPQALISVFKKLISIRKALGINERNYVSSLINAEPGLEERIRNAELILSSDRNKTAKEERREQ